jgi:geranylgeranylglycerol-phosphate geranylgeranyltransferase
MINRLVSDNRLRSKVIAISDLIKPELPFAAGVCVIAGEVLALGRLPGAAPSILGFLVGFFISASAMVSNDYFDQEVDRINRPDRPLPSGRVTAREVVLLTIVLSSIGLLAAAFLGIPAFVLALITWVVGMSYNWRFKSSGLPGNMMVAFSVSITFIFGGLAVGNLNGLVLTFGVLAFIFDLSEEIINGSLDSKGDEKRSSRSIAIVYGRKAAMRLSGALFAAFIVISFIPFLAGWLGPLYLGMVSCVDIAIIVLFILLSTRNGRIKEERMIVRFLYITMLLFIISFLIVVAL